MAQCFGDWDDSLKDLVRLADDKVIVRKLYMLPTGFPWKSKGSVMLVGDAAHLMTPFASIRVNLTMHDALTLANAIVERRDEEGGLAAAVEGMKRPCLRCLSAMRRNIGESGVVL